MFYRRLIYLLIAPLKVKRSMVWIYKHKIETQHQVSTESIIPLFISGSFCILYLSPVHGSTFPYILLSTSLLLLWLSLFIWSFHSLSVGRLFVFSISLSSVCLSLYPYSHLSAFLSIVSPSVYLSVSLSISLSTSIIQHHALHKPAGEEEPNGRTS